MTEKITDSIANTQNRTYCIVCFKFIWGLDEFETVEIQVSNRTIERKVCARCWKFYKEEAP